MLPARADVGLEDRPVGEERLWGEAWNWPGRADLNLRRFGGVSKAHRSGATGEIPERSAAVSKEL